MYVAHTQERTKEAYTQINQRANGEKKKTFIKDNHRLDTTHMLKSGLSFKTYFKGK